MLKKYSNVLITGDLHLGDAFFRFEEKLIGIIKNNRFDCVVFGGDTFDPWRGDTVRELIAKYHQIFKELQKLSGKVIFLKGNHDPYIDYLKNLGFNVKQKFKYLSGAGKIIKVTHGHEFDSYCRRVEFFTKKIVWLEEKINRVLLKLDNRSAVRFIDCVSKFDLTNIVNDFYRQISSYRNIDSIIFGHTHLPWEGKKGDISFYNWGGWQNNLGLQPSYIVNRGAEINIHYVK